MRALVGEITHVIKRDYHRGAYIYALIFLAICISLNYSFDFQRQYVKSAHGGWLEMLYYFLFYGFAYYGMVVPLLLIRKRKDLLVSGTFWMKSLFVVALISVASGFSYFHDLLSNIQGDGERKLLMRSVGHIKRMLVYLPFILLARLFWDRDDNTLYGIGSRKLKLMNYFLLFIIISPLIISASFLPDFIKAYPRYKPWLAETAFNLPAWLQMLFYELAYGIDYIGVEWIFRGVLVIGMMRLMGTQSILPMTAIYCFIHFGKPMGESISSIFGGYILGIIAMNTRSIWGGVIIHLGIAWLMEIAGIFQYYVLSSRG